MSRPASPTTPPPNPHRDQDLAWSNRSTPTGSGTGQRPKSILRNAADRPVVSPDAALLSDDDSRPGSASHEHIAQTAEALLGKRLASAPGHAQGVSGATAPTTATQNPNAPVQEVDAGEAAREAERAGLSARAGPCEANGVMMRRFVDLYTNEYHPNDNPDGLISLGVAENHLMDDEIIQKIKDAVSSSVTSQNLGYGDGMASRRLTRALSSYLNDYFHPLEPVTPDHLLVGNGCSPIFDHLGHVLCDPTDAILIPAPFGDFETRTFSKVHPADVGNMDEGFEPSMVAALQAKVDLLKSKEIKTRLLIFTNPHNPLGRTYPRETILAVAQFAQANDIHLVVNEIYANSVYDNDRWPDAPPFVSALSIDFARELPGFELSRLHVMYGMSKDFCANGLRVGVLISQHNPTFVTAMTGLSFFAKSSRSVSSLSDVVWADMLSDRAWLEWFLAENKRRLGQAMVETRSWFEKRGVTVSRSNGGNFFMVDLGSALGKSTVEGEQEIAGLLNDTGVSLSPGAASFNPTPGWFRITFCQEKGKLLAGLDRIERVLGLTVRV